MPSVRRAVEEVGFAADLLGDCLAELGRGALGRGALRARAVAAEAFEIGVRPLRAISFLAVAIGLILGASTTWVPAPAGFGRLPPLEALASARTSMNFIGILVLRELTPLLLAIFVASRSGVALTARLGAMRVSHAIDALVVMGISPAGFIVLPSLLAMLLALIALTVWCDMLTLAGTALWFSWRAGISTRLGIAYLTEQVSMRHVLIGPEKALCFAILIPVIAAVNGSRLDATSGGESQTVARAATAAVVQSLVAIIVVTLVFAVA